VDAATGVWARYRLAVPAVKMQSMRSAEGAVEVLRRAVQAGELPGWALAAGVGDELELLETGGFADTGAGTRPVTPHTLFDIASLTKVVATLPITLALLRDGVLALDTRVVDHLPAFDTAPPKREITVEQLLTHTSGLPATGPYGTQRLSADTIRERLLAESLERPPGSRVTYSDVGFLVLGQLVEQVGGATLDVLLARHVTGPLGLSDTGYGPVDPGRAAATERRPDGTICRGYVHDEIAAQLDGPAAHAGVFSTVGELATYLAAWVSPSDAWLAPALRRQATSDHTSHLGGHRGLGWTARNDPYDQLGDAWPQSAVFHSGFTGTSLALDPDSRRWVVLLTNDVHFGRGRGTINPLRRAVHTALAPPPAIESHGWPRRT
jgi:CubicO group peptidase (beta-lactamase class C family)